MSRLDNCLTAIVGDKLPIETARKTFFFLLGIAVMLIVIALPSPSPFYKGEEAIPLTANAKIVMAVLCFAVIQWMTEAIPFPATSLCLIVFLHILGVASFDKLVTLGFGNNVLLFLMGAMGEIEPGHIHTHFHHTPESCLIGTGWPQRTDNLCLAHQTIHHTFLYAAVAVLFSLYRSSLEIATENAPGLQNPQSFYRVPFPAHFTASFSFPFWSPGVFDPLSLDKRSRLYYAYCISYISTLSTDAGTVLLL